MPSSTATIRSATASSTARSCETSSTVPGNASSAASSASRLSRSRWFVGSSRTRKFAPRRRRAPARAGAARRPRARRPASRARPSPRRGSGRAAPAPAARCSPVAPIAHSSTLPRSSSSTSCWEKYASSTPWPSRPSRRRSRSPRAVSTCPEPFGPISATCSPRSSTSSASCEQLLRARGEVEALGLERPSGRCAPA